MIDSNGRIEKFVQGKTVTTIELGETSKEVNEQEEFTILATANGSEDLIWNWKKISGDVSEVLEITTEKSSDGLTTTAKITPNATGTGELTVSAPNATAKTCTVTIKAAYIDYSYVEYDVSYTDVYDSNKKYTKNTGWRLLTPDSKLGESASTEGAAATYTGDIEIISTGIPTGLYYNDDYITKSGYNIWSGTSTDITNYLNEGFYSGKSNTGKNMYAVSGLYYHFDKINFKQQDGNTTKNKKEYNTGYYTAISKNGTAQTGTITGDIFIAKEEAKVRSVTYADWIRSKNDFNSYYVPTEIRPGLFALEKYTPSIYDKGFYWLASPYKNDEYCIANKAYAGQSIPSFSTNSYSGVRPVITLTGVTITRASGSHVWKIQ